MLTQEINIKKDINLNVAQSTGLGYAQIKKIALHMNDNLGLRELKDFNLIITEMGGKIVRNSNEFNNPDVNYLEFYKNGTFKVVFPEELSAQLERFLLAQILDYFVLHAKRGASPCYLHKMGDDIIELEGFWFASSLLIDDELIIKRIYEGKSLKELSNEFDVPEFAIKGKCKILETLYLK